MFNFNKLKYPSVYITINNVSLIIKNAAYGAVR